LLTVLGLNAVDGSYTVVRGALGSSVTTHAANDPVLLLDSTSIIVPFTPNFFENQASANYMHTISLPDVRILAAEFVVANAFGSSQATTKSYAYEANIDPDQTLRTLSGGQFSLQVNGYLATQQNAAPPLFVEASHAVRDIRATVSMAANGFDISVQVLQNGLAYGSALIIPSGTTTSAALIMGAALPPLVEGALLTINVTLNTGSAVAANGPNPGRDLTVTIRL
jgi:hypothetical protein